MIVRRYTPEDLKVIDELWRKHHAHQFSLPKLQPSIIDCVVEDDKGIVAFGNLKVFAEAVMIMDHDRSPIVRAKALREMMPIGIMAAQRSGIAEIHLVSQDPDYAELLRKHYGFTTVLGEHLVKEVE